MVELRLFISWDVANTVKSGTALVRSHSGAAWAFHLSL